MTVVIKYDPWAERPEAERTRDGLTALGFDVELQEVRLTRPGVDRVESAAPEGVTAVLGIEGRYLRFVNGLLVGAS